LAQIRLDYLGPNDHFVWQAGGVQEAQVMDLIWPQYAHAHLFASQISAA
jgi:hypothetical protein